MNENIHNCVLIVNLAVGFYSLFRSLQHALDTAVFLLAYQCLHSFSYMLVLFLLYNIFCHYCNIDLQLYSLGPPGPCHVCERVELYHLECGVEDKWSLSCKARQRAP